MFQITNIDRRKNVVSDSTVRRLSGYLRRLFELENERIEIVSSKELAERNGVTSAQVRKDFSLFGKFGRMGEGYHVSELKNRIALILGVNKTWKVALVGCGNIGTALFHYKEFRKQGFSIVAIFDSDPNKIGHKIDSAEIYSMDCLCDVVKEKGIEIAIIAVPDEVVQSVADKVVQAGIKAILSFPMRRISVPQDVLLRYVNLAVDMEGLSFGLVNEERRRKKQ